MSIGYKRVVTAAPRPRKERMRVMDNDRFWICVWSVILGGIFLVLVGLATVYFLGINGMAKKGYEQQTNQVMCNGQVSYTNVWVKAKETKK